MLMFAHLWIKVQICKCKVGAQVQVEFHKTHEKPIIGQVWSSWHQISYDKDQDGQGEARNL